MGLEIVQKTKLMGSMLKFICFRRMHSNSQSEIFYFTLEVAYYQLFQSIRVTWPVLSYKKQNPDEDDQNQLTDYSIHLHFVGSHEITPIRLNDDIDEKMPPSTSNRQSAATPKQNIMF